MIMKQILFSLLAGSFTFQPCFAITLSECTNLSLFGIEQTEMRLAIILKDLQNPIECEKANQKFIKYKYELKKSANLFADEYQNTCYFVGLTDGAYSLYQRKTGCLKFENSEGLKCSEILEQITDVSAITLENIEFYITSTLMSDEPVACKKMILEKISNL